MSVAFNIVPTLEKIHEINSKITEYWENDIWDINHSFFDDIRPNKCGSRRNTINFNMLPIALKDEVKFFFIKRLSDQTLRLHSAVTYGNCLSRLSEFLNRIFPKATSFIDISLDKSITKWRSYLVEQGMKIGKDGRLSSQSYEVILQQLCTFYKNFYDIRDEFEKDIWDVRNIPGARYNRSNADYMLNFTGTPSIFRPLVKRYIKTRIAKFSQGQCAIDLIGIKLFLTYIHKYHPAWNNLNELLRIDMENYLTWYRQYTAEFKAMHITYYSSLRTFIEYIQRAEYHEAPITPSVLLIWKEDMPRRLVKTQNSIKFIPEEVLLQMEDCLEHLESEYALVVILFRASGWRISDIFNLRYDTCLERTAQGWWLCGDIPKTQVLSHRIPITDENAAIVQGAIKEVKGKSKPDNNPKKYLFVRLNGKRKGLPPTAESVRDALNRLAKQCNIVNDQGQLYHFGNHAFRHTKAVELINNGMNILHVQKWMAHASPEMTLCYAKILDNTMRKSWEEAMKNGAFRLDTDGKPVKVDISSIENEYVIEWEYIRHNLDAVRMPLGYCLKPKKLECKHQLNPCLTCRNLCTTPDFISQYEFEIREVKALIERGKSQNQILWIEKNKHLLERYETILAVLREGKAHHLAGKKGREYVGEERHNVRSST